MFRSLFGRHFVAALSSVLLMVMILSLLVFPATAFAASSVTLNSTKGSAGTQVTGTGSNWTPGHKINVTLDAGTSLGSTTVQSDGSFRVSFTIPANATQGNLSIDFADGAGNLGFFIPVTFTVTSGSPPSSSPSPSPSSTVDLETIDIQSLQSLLADSNVTFRANIRNNGSTASGAFNIRWIADGKMTFDGSDPSLAPGASTTHDHIWNQRGMGNLTPGQHTLTFIANFDHCISESNYDNNQFTLTFTVASPTLSSPPTTSAPQSTLFVFVQGINSSYSGTGIPGDSFGGIISFDLKKKYSDANFLMYVYPHPDRGESPNSYRCEDTFTSTLGDYVAALKSQIINYMQQHPNTKVEIIGHSMGGAIAYGLLVDMMVNGYITTNGGSIAGVATLDSPLGGFPEGPGISSLYYQQTLKVFSDNNHCHALSSLDLTGKALWQLTQIFGHVSYGASDNLALVINGADFSNQEVAKAAVRHSTHVLTIGNLKDYLYQPGDCTLVGLGPHTHFIDTQVITDGGTGSGIYARLFADGVPACNGISSIAINHNIVLFESTVVDDLIQLTAGETPRQLM